MVLNNKYLGIKLWVWIVILIMIYLFMNSKEPFTNQTQTNNSVQTQIITKEKFKMFNFNTSWCGWSKRFQPEWDILVNTINTPSTDTDDEEIRKVLRENIAFLDIKCDEDENIDLCNQYDIPGYPYIIIENVNNKDRYIYNNERTAVEMYKFLVNNIYKYIKDYN
jgi:hypothetical protein